VRIREWEWKERGERRREGKVRAGVCIGKGEGFR